MFHSISLSGTLKMLVLIFAMLSPYKVFVITEIILRSEMDLLIQIQELEDKIELIR